MWIPSSLFKLIEFGQEQRSELVALRSANALLERRLIAADIMSDFMRMRVNQLEAERSVLMNQAYPGLSLPSPEIARIQRRPKSEFSLQALFEDQEETELSPVPSPFQ